MKNSLLVIFDKIPCTIVQSNLSNFGATLKIHKKSNFDQNQPKFSTQHKNMYLHHKIKYKRVKSFLFTCNHFHYQQQIPALLRDEGALIGKPNYVWSPK